MEERGIFTCFVIIVLTYLLSRTEAGLESGYCETGNNELSYDFEDEKCSRHSLFDNKRFIFYDVNPPEGFNLRRDVYVRTAIFIKFLTEKNTRYDWRLVLPPWENLYHWRSRDFGPQIQIPWATFFDLPSLKKYAPVIEMQEFFDEYAGNGKTANIDRIYVLKNDENMFKTGDFEDKNQIVECDKALSGSKMFIGGLWGYSNLTVGDTKCLVFHGSISGLEKNLYPEIYRSVMFHHMEIALHDSYGSKEYWMARRSMRYNSELYKIAADYRREFLNSNDIDDKTELPDDWTKERERRDALGGPYLSVHLRRRDFLTGRANSVPSIKGAADQLRKKMEKLDLRVIFVATDAENQEYEELKSYLEEYIVVKYSPSDNVRKFYKDGGVAIIDQIICSRARYFIGTHESTFTFRIQEDREIVGFPSKTTFNRLCGKEKKCKTSSAWKIVWR